MRFETMTIHGKDKHENAHRALTTPIYQTSTFSFDNLQQVDDVMNFRSSDYVYTRGNNPTLRDFEERIAALEGGVGAVAFGSGMAAISSVLMSFLAPGDRVVFHRTLYGSSYTFLTQFMKKYQVEAISLDLATEEGIARLGTLDAKVVYLETPTNPVLDSLDLVAIAKHKGEATLVVDNTFMTPYLQRPLGLGADVVVHSATKYIGGHGDVVAGVAVASDQEYVNRLKFDYMCELGGVLSPFDAYLLLRGLKTLAVRMDRHERNADAIADYLSGRSEVERVYRPERIEGQMEGRGGMVAFTLKDEHLDRVDTFFEALDLMTLAVSLGDCETLIEMPARMTHLGYSDEALAEAKIPKSLIRISAGLEHQEDLIDDLKQALDTLGG